jgi:hypothetical protein
MSHELEQCANGSTAFVAGHNKDAWHQLGTVLPPASPPKTSCSSPTWAAGMSASARSKPL